MWAWDLPSIIRSAGGGSNFRPDEGFKIEIRNTNRIKLKPGTPKAASSPLNQTSEGSFRASFVKHAMVVFATLRMVSPAYPWMPCHYSRRGTRTGFLGPFCPDIK
jgi:hypothetical protein